MTVQGPVKEQQPDGMSHRGGGGALKRSPASTSHSQRFDGPAPESAFRELLARLRPLNNFRPPGGSVQSTLNKCLEGHQGQ